MGNPFGIQHVNQPIVDIFNTWWSVRPENDIHKILLKITPSIICWENGNNGVLVNLEAKDTSATVR